MVALIIIDLYCATPDVACRWLLCNVECAEIVCRRFCTPNKTAMDSMDCKAEVKASPEVQVPVSAQPGSATSLQLAWLKNFVHSNYH